MASNVLLHASLGRSGMLGNNMRDFLYDIGFWLCVALLLIVSTFAVAWLFIVFVMTGWHLFFINYDVMYFGIFLFTLIWIGFKTLERVHGNIYQKFVKVHCRRYY